MSTKAKAAAPRPMTDQMERFVQEYLVDCNATAAAARAKYRQPNVQGPRLLKDPRIAAAIQAAMDKRAKKTGITAERVLLEAETLAFSCVDHYMVGEDGRLCLAPGAPPDAMRAVSSVKYKTRTIPRRGEEPEVEHEVEFKLWDKPGMVKLTGRHVDLHGFADRVELTGKDGGPIEAVAAVTVEIVPARGAKP
jgi:phage terminase small subunit